MSKWLFESTLVGLLCRISALCLMLTWVLMLFFGLRYAECLPSVVTPRDLILVFGLVVTTTVLGQVFSEYPTGDDALMTRLNLSIAARSGLLLIVIFGLRTTQQGLVEMPLLAVLIALYCVGLFFGIFLDTCRLNRQDSA